MHKGRYRGQETIVVIFIRTIIIYLRKELKESIINSNINYIETNFNDKIDVKGIQAKDLVLGWLN